MHLTQQPKSVVETFFKITVSKVFILTLCGILVASNDIFCQNIRRLRSTVSLSGETVKDGDGRFTMLQSIGQPGAIGLLRSNKLLIRQGLSLIHI